jgi:transcriptional regulator with GAF, ATPase, and Fis domain/orotate phosphoribosyltransferase/hypoxanthine phosphoribosyltransferase
MEAIFSFLNYGELIQECLSENILDKDTQASCVSEKLLNKPVKSIRVLDFIGTDHITIRAKHLERSLFPAIRKFKDEYKTNLPLVLTHVSAERRNILDRAKQLQALLSETKGLILVINEYGQLDRILGAEEGIQEFLMSCMENELEYPIQTNLFSSQADSDLIKRNSWLCTRKKDRYDFSFSLQRLINDMTLNIIKEKLHSIQKKHIQLLSGKHTLEYISSTALSSNPELIGWMARVIYARFKKSAIDCIVSYSDQSFTLLLLLKQEFDKDGRIIEPLIMENYDEPYLKDSRPYYKKCKGKKALIVLDVTSSGQLPVKIVNTIRNEGGKIQGVAIIVDARTNTQPITTNYFTLCKYPIVLYDPGSKNGSCPGCREQNSQTLYYIDPRINSPIPVPSGKQSLQPVYLCNEENKRFWEWVRKTDALKTHIILGETKRHYYYYIDTFAVLTNYIEKVNWRLECLYPDGQLPEVILHPNNHSARLIAWHLFEMHVRRGNLIPAENKTGIWTIGDESKLNNRSILIVDDGANTGRTIKGLLNLCRRVNGSIDRVKICIFLDRLGPDDHEDLIAMVPEKNIRSVYRIPIPAFTDDQKHCPLCLEISQLEKYNEVMSLEAQAYIKDRLKKIKEKNIQQGERSSGRSRNESPESTISRGKALDFLYSKGDHAFLMVLRRKIPIKELSLILEAIPPEYIRMRDIKEWLSRNIQEVKGISHLTKFLRMLLMVHPEIIWNHLDHIIEQFAKSHRNQFLTYILEYLVWEKVINKSDLRNYLNEALKKWREYSEFIAGIINSVIFKYPDELMRHPSHFKIYENIVLKIAQSNASTLITGETGTGKGVLAKIIHDTSKKEKDEFVKINVFNLSPTLIESELFGHEKGAFTGADKLKIGKLEIADGGTAFFDEIGDIPLHLQGKILRALEDKEFEKVGGTKTIKSDFRIICATNKDLKELIANGDFREDLYYRINVIPIYLPPLRETPEDIRGLAKYFLQFYCYKNNKGLIEYDDEIHEALISYSWPGNVRELKNAIERAVLLSENKSEFIEQIKSVCQNSIAKDKFEQKPFKERHGDSDRHIILDALEKHNWNISRTSTYLNITRQWLHKLIKKHNIKKPFVHA